MPTYRIHKRTPAAAFVAHKTAIDEMLARLTAFSAEQRPMTPTQYTTALRMLGLTTAAGAPVLGILRRQSFRYAAGDAPIPEVVAKLVRALLELSRTEV